MQAKLIKNLVFFGIFIYFLNDRSFSEVKGLGSINFDVNSNNSPEMILNSTGLGIGASPSENLHVAGNVIVTGSLGVGGQNVSGSNFHVQGSWGYGLQTVSDNVILGNSSIVLADTTGGNLTIECPIASSVEGRVYTIKKISLLNTLTLAGGPFDGRADLTLSSNSSLSSLSLLSSGGNWHILSLSGNGATVGSDNLIGWWKLDESTGNIAYDTSSYSNNGNLLNGLNFSTNGGNGVIGNKLSFIPASSHVINVGTTNFLRLTSSFSLSLWFYSSSNNQRGMLLGRTQAPPNNHNFFIQFYDTWLQFGMYNGSSWPKAESTNTAITNTWHHILGSYRGGALTLYLDGTKFAENASAGNPAPGGTCNLSIGANYAENANYFNGSLDDIRIYNKALEASEVQMLYRQGR